MAECQHCGGRGYTSYHHEGMVINNGCERCGGKGSDYRSYGSPSFRKGTGSEGCFPKGIKILMPDGGKNIEDIVRGERVISISRKGEVSDKQVIQKVVHAKNRIWKINLKNGKSISTTKIHSFLLSRGWEKAGRIVSGDMILDARGDYIEVLNSYMSDECEPVYNLIIADNFTYIAEDVQVHCFTYFRKTQMVYWRVLNNWGQSKLKFSGWFAALSQPKFSG